MSHMPALAQPNPNDFHYGITPPALPAGETNDYDPAGFLTADVIYQDVNAAGSTLTGLDAQLEGFAITLVNINANANLTIAHNDSSSEAANRFHLPSGENLSIPPDGAVRFIRGEDFWRAEIIPSSGGSTDLINVATCGAVGDGTTNDTAAIQAAITVAIAVHKGLYFPFGTYSLVTVGLGSMGIHHGLEIPAGTTNLKWVGASGATIKWDSTTNTPSANCAVYIGAGCSNITVEGIKFQGYTGYLDDDKVFNCGGAFYVASGAVDFSVLNNRFDHIATMQFATSDTSRNLLFQGNRVWHAPLGLNPPDNSKILGNWFEASAIVANGSHAIYVFGHAEGGIIQGNHFKYISTQTIQIRAGDARRQQKGHFIIANNMFEGCGFNSIWCGSDNAPLPSGWTVTGNHHLNCNSPLQFTNMRSSKVADNTYECDYRFRGTMGGNAIQVSTDFDHGYSTAKDISITDNTIVNRHPFYAEVTIGVTGTKAGLDMDAAGNSTNMSTIIRAKQGGTRGNDITVELVPGAPTAAGVLLEYGRHVRIVYKATATASTVSQIETLIGTSTLIEVQTTGVGATSLTAGDAFDTVALAGGANTVLPANNDTITIGHPLDTVTYTWKTTPSTTGDILIGANIDLCASALGQELRGLGNSDPNQILRDATDVWYSDVNTGEGKCWVASDETFTISRTGTAVAVSAVVNNSNVFQDCINVLDCINPVIRGNLCNNGTDAGNRVVVRQCISPVITENVFPEGGTGIVSNWNVFPVIENNRISQDTSLHSATMAQYHTVESYDAFAVLHNNGTVSDQNATLPFLQGKSGYVSIGDGKARTYLFYGASPKTNNPKASRHSWQDGMQSTAVRRCPGTVFRQFRFKEVIASATTQFNSYASLVALINTQTAGMWTATNPVVDFFGSDTIGDGYIEIKFAAAGVPQPDAQIDTTPASAGGFFEYRGSRLNGVTLKKWAVGNATDSPFAGGAATAIKTAVFTPLASTNVPLFVQGVDAASQALNPIAYQADTIPGICYVITHSVAVTGTEKFFYRVG